MRRALLLSFLSLPLLARLPAVAQEAPASLAASDGAVARLAERLARLEEDGLDPRHYAVPDPA
ncbi:murein L,D-transpeptidase, partial [Roseomonas alkaliterrae]|nr:murein L,D-transpeptidase [Neoroseomonas alkaliterrae]